MVDEGLTTPEGRPTAVVQVTGEPMGQGDEEDPEGRGGIGGSGDQCGGGAPEGHSGAGGWQTRGVHNVLMVG